MGAVDVVVTKTLKFSMTFRDRNNFYVVVVHIFIHSNTRVTGETCIIYNHSKEILVHHELTLFNFFPHFLVHFAVFIKCCVILAAIHTVDFICWDTIFCIFMFFLAYIFFMMVCWVLVATDGTPRLVFTKLSMHYTVVDS